MTNPKLAEEARRIGHLDEAAQHYRQLLTQDPSNPRWHLCFGEILLQQGKRIEALPYLQTAVHGLKHPVVQALYAEALSKMRFSRTEPSLKRDVLMAIDHAWCRPADMVGTAISLLRAEHGLSPETAAVMVQTCSGLVADPLLHAVLRSAPNIDEQLEDWLIWARQALLQLIVPGHAKTAHLPFALALAMQSWIGEFVLAETNEESTLLDQVALSLATRLQQGERYAELNLAMLAAYRPLNEWGWAKELLWTEPSPLMNRILSWHLRHPHQEQKIAAHMPRLSEITDATSQKVRAQYEANPYPRWVAAPTNIGRQPLSEYVRNRFPALQEQQGTFNTSPCEVLIAGCGTGQEIMGTAATLADVSITAIDISLSSLAYAKRMAMENGIVNVNFMQADIIELGRLNRQFSMIECAGVLHHLHNPEAGWKILTDLLKPGGLMMIALYSRAARRDLDPAREWVREKQISTDAESIKKFRTRVKSLPAEHPCRRIVARRDFFTTSMLRDLVFHVNEHEFNLLEIQAISDRLGLNFLGFDLPPESKQQFAAVFPSKTPWLDLKSWDKFEKLYPDTFRGMYQMWFYKP